MKRIFIIGTQRSGSNLLRVILNSHSELLAPHPPNVLKHFVPLEPLYNKLNDSEIMHNHILELIKLNPVKWEGFDFNPKEIAKDKPAANVYEFFLQLMDKYASSQNLQGWVCKSTHNFKYTEELRAANKDLLFIHLYRDPRDVCLSFGKADIGDKHPYAIAEKWNSTQIKCLEILERLPRRNHFSIQYESLLNNPTGIIKKLCERIGIEFEPNMLEYYKAKSTQICSQAGKRWENLKNPIMTNNSKKYRNNLTSNQIKVIENVAQEAMLKLGYELDYPSDAITLQEKEIASYKKINEALIKEKNKMDNPQNAFIQSIKNEFLSKNAVAQSQ